MPWVESDDCVIAESMGQFYVSIDTVVAFVKLFLIIVVSCTNAVS